MSAWKRLRAHRREGDLGGGSSAHSRVERAVDSARAPGTARELAREEEATRAFRDAHLALTHQARRGIPMPLTSPRTGLKAATASAAAVALLSTGAAFAASGHAPWAGSAATRPTAVPSHSHPTDDPSETASDDPSESGDTDAPDGDGSAGPNEHAFPGLCRAYGVGNKTERGDALSSPAFTALVTAAGGPDAVAGFCASLVPAHVHPAKPSHPQPTHTVPTHPVPTHPVPTHPVPTHSAHTHPAAPSHPGNTHPSTDSHPSRP